MAKTVASVAIVGAGQSGLQTAAQFQHAGFSVSIFDSGSDIGGLWQSNYDGCTLQVQTKYFEAPGLPFPKDASAYATRAEVQAYLKDYARAHDLLSKVKLQHHVLKIEPKDEDGSAGWLVHVAHADTDTLGDAHVESFDYVVVCIGLYNLPNMPDWAQKYADTFNGPIIPAKDFTTKDMAADKRVLVVGGSKSAWDCAYAASQVAEHVTLLARRSHWLGSRYIAGKIPTEQLLYNRFGGVLLPEWYSTASVWKWLHTRLTFLKRAFHSRVMMPGMIKELGFPDHFVPKSVPLDDLYGHSGVVDNTMGKHMFQHVDCKLGEVTAVKPTEVVLSSGETLKADLIICATGYKQTESTLFTAAIRAAAGVETDGVWLYRQILPPQVQNLAFVGASSSFQSVPTSALQAWWLCSLWTGQLPMPTQHERQADIAAYKEHIRSSTFPRYSNNWMNASCGKYHDQLLRDAGLSPWRKGWNLFAEVLAPYSGHDYASLFPANAEAAARSKGFFVSMEHVMNKQKLHEQ
jgi:dimethylaniline monooxygenase (N-oxide forming)